MTVIFGFSSISQTPSLPGQTDKGVHGLLYAGLGWLLLRALSGGWVRVTGKAVLLAVIIATLYGVSDEYHQSFVPSRQSDARDVVADCIGAAAGAIVGAVWSRRRTGVRRPPV